MTGIFAGNIGQQSLSRWVPWFLLATVALYFVGYVDGSVHGAAFGAAFGAAGTKLAVVHEFFHHARHIALMCH